MIQNMVSLVNTPCSLEKNVILIFLGVFLWLLGQDGWYVHVKLLSHVWLFVIPWTVARQVPLSMGLSRQKYWSGFPIYSGSLLNISCIFSILVSSLCICNSILFSRFWIIFTIIISGRFPISSSFVWFGGHLSCSFTCWIFLCLFILFRLLCLGWPFCML